MKKLIYLSLSLLILTKVSATEICPRLTLQETIQNGHDCNPYGEIIIKVEGLDDGVYNHNFYYDTPDNKAVAFGNATVVSGVLKLSVLPGVYRNIRFSEDSVCGNIGDVTIYDVAQPLSFYHPKFCSLENKTLSDLMATMPGVKWFKGNVEITDKNIPLVEGDEYNYQSGCLRIPYIVQVDNVEKPQVTVDCSIVLGKAKITVVNPVEGYTYSLNGGAFQTSLEFTSVPNGSHVITAKSNNDCTAQSDKITIFCDPLEPIVYIPNASFKRVLVNNLEINTNNDSEIQVSEALKITKLELGSCTGYLEGLLAFENLEELIINSWNNGCEVDEPAMIALKGSVESYKIDLSKLKKLTYLNCGYGGCGSVSIENTLSLKSLFLEKDNITVKGCDNLETISLNNCYANNKGEYDFSNLVGLKKISITDGDIESINLKDSNNIEIFELDASPSFKYFDFRTLNKLSEVRIIQEGEVQVLLSNNSLKKFTLVASTCENIDLSEAVNLEILNLEGSSINNLNIKNGSIFNNETNINFENSDLKSICVDEGEYEFVKGLADKYGYKPTITTDCATLSVSENELNTLNTTFSPNPTQGKITFTEKVDEVKVFDLSGRLVKSIIANTTEVDLSDLQNGVYMMQVSKNQKTFTTKVVKE